MQLDKMSAGKPMEEKWKKENGENGKGKKMEAEAEVTAVMACNLVCVSFYEAAAVPFHNLIAYFFGLPH